MSVRRLWHWLYGHGAVADTQTMTNGMVAGYCETCDRAVRLR